MTGVLRQIGRYTIDGVVGTGAFATVYRATDERLDTTVAIKLLADNHCLDPDIRARFMDEGRALRRVDSIHVVRVHDVGETEQLQPYLVLEHADRGTLGDRVEGMRATGWRPARDDLRAVLEDLGAAVEAVHAASLVHRDLSPGNILLRSAVPLPAPRAVATPLLATDERLVVADLGLAKDLARHSGLTAAAGTDGFRPPEQRGGPAQIDGRADLWALSALLFWLVTGQAPGTAGDTRQRDRMLAAALADLGLPSALRGPLLTGLADEPAKRHPDVAAWRAAVTEALTPPPPTSLPDRAAVADGGTRVSRRGLILGGALVLLGGATLGAVVTRQLDASGEPRLTTTQLDDGQVEVSDADSAGEARLVLVGPEQAPVGEVVTLEAEATGVEHWVWVMPDGTVYVDEPSVQLRTQSAGTATVTLTGVAESGGRLEVVYELRLVED